MFQSGVAFGAGMTFQLDKKKHNGITYLDTPGLSDIKLRKQAAEAITTALKQGGTYQVFFVITLEAGRVRPEDMTTIKLVLESATDIKHFSIIINKLSKKAFNGLLAENAEQLKTMITELVVLINSKDNPPTVLLLELQNNLFDEENKFIDWDELNEFVTKAPSITLKSTCVKELEGDPYSFQEALEALRTQIEELRKDNGRLKKMQKETETKYKTLVHRDLVANLEKRLSQRKKPNEDEPQPPQEEESREKTTEEVSKGGKKSEVGKKLLFHSLILLLCYPSILNFKKRQLEEFEL